MRPSDLEVDSARGDARPVRARARRPVRRSAHHDDTLGRQTNRCGPTGGLRRRMTAAHVGQKLGGVTTHSDTDVTSPGFWYQWGMVEL